MLHFFKSLIHGVGSFANSAGRDSRRTFCEIFTPLILLVIILAALFIWRDAEVLKPFREVLFLSNVWCIVLFVLSEGFLLTTIYTAMMRRWQDLDIPLPKDVTLKDLMSKGRFWEVLMTEEGSIEPNRYGEAPADNPVPLIDPKELKEAVRKKLFVDIDGIEEIK